MKQKKAKEQNLKEQEQAIGISKTGKKIIFSAIIILILGYYILTKTDSMGQNWASIASPFLILGGYIMVGIGIIFPDSKPQQN